MSSWWIYNLLYICNLLSEQIQFIRICRILAFLISAVAEFIADNVLDMVLFVYTIVSSICLITAMKIADKGKTRHKRQWRTFSVFLNKIKANDMTQNKAIHLSQGSRVFQKREEIEMTEWFVF